MLSCFYLIPERHGRTDGQTYRRTKLLYQYRASLYWRAIKNERKNHTFWSTAGARPTIPTILGMVIEDVRPVFAPPAFFDPISSFAAKGYWKFEGKCPYYGKMLITWLFDPKSNQIKNLKSTWRRVQSWEFRKNLANEWSLMGKFMAKIRNSDSFGRLYSHISASINMKFGTGDICQISCLSGQRVAPAGRKKNIFGPLSKNNTGIRYASVQWRAILI